MDGMDAIGLSVLLHAGQPSILACMIACGVTINEKVHIIRSILLIIDVYIPIKMTV